MKFFKLFITILCSFNFAFAQSSDIVLQGKILDTNIKYIAAAKYSGFYTETHSPKLIGEAQIDPSHIFSLKFNIHKPVVVQLMIPNKNIDVYLSPADTVNLFMNRTGDQIEFSGTNAANCNYAIQLQNYSSKIGIPEYKAGMDLKLFQKKAYKFYEQEIGFLSEYKSKNKLSTGFVNYAKDDIVGSYILALYEPFWVDTNPSKKFPNDYFELSDRLINRNKNKLSLSDTYNTILIFRYILFRSQSDNFNAIYANIIRNFKNPIRNYLISNLIGLYAEKQMHRYRSSLLYAIDKFQPSSQNDTTYINYLNRTKKFLSAYDNALPDNVLLQDSVTCLGSDERMTLKQLFDKYPQTPVYLDFWASWCVPCLEDIAISQRTKDYLRSNGFKYIYISVDDGRTEKDWRAASKEHGIVADQFRLTNISNSAIKKFFKIKAIPRYVILGKDHSLKNSNAPHPTPADFSKLKESITDALAQ